MPSDDREALAALCREVYLRTPADQGSTEPTAKPHDHAKDPKVWCETHQHEHIASMPRFTYLCKDCGWGQWYGNQAREHEYWTQENLREAHVTYEVEHVTHPLATEPTPKAARETLAYIDMCLALPMCQNAISEYGQGVVETFQAVRKLLLGGMHPDMRARLEAALSTHTNDRTE